MLILGFFFLSKLFIAFIILPTLSADKAGNTFLIHRISSIFGKIFILEICTYDFLTFKGFVFFLVIVLIFLVEGSITEVAVEREITPENGVGVNTGGVVFSFGFVVFEVINHQLYIVIALSSAKEIYNIFVNSQFLFLVKNENIPF